MGYRKRNESLRGFWEPDPTTVRALADGNRRWKAARDREQTAIIDGVHDMAATRKTVRKTEATPASKASTQIPLKKCLPTGMETKTARRILRKKGLSFHDSKERYMFTPAQAEKVRELLRG